MSESLADLKERLIMLTPDEREELAQFLLDSLDGQEGDATQEEIDAAWEAELLRRVDDFKQGRVKAIPAEEVFESLRKKYS